jgi:large subunit ribosomal protein L27
MAHTKSLGSTKLGRDSASKRLGIKIQDGSSVGVGEILIRQRGSRYLAGTGVAKGGDDTLYAKISGIVKFSNKKKQNFDRSFRTVKVVNVQPLSA